MSSTKFRVRLWAFSGKGLPAKDRSGSSDPFFQLNFDNFRTAKSPIVKKCLDPSWEFSMEFFYDTRWLRKLDKKALKLDVYDYDMIGANDYIGGAAVDLHTLATGPVAQSLLLRDGGKPAGRIEFCCQFEMYSEVCIMLKSLHVTGLPSPEGQGGEAIDPYMQYYFSARDLEKDARPESAPGSPYKDFAEADFKVYKTSTLVGTDEPTWAEAELAHFRVTLREMLDESLVLRFRHNRPARKDPLCGEARLSMRKYAHPTREGVLTKFTETIRPASGTGPAGTVEGVVVFSKLPVFGQMQGGKHTELGVEGGAPLMDGIEMPRNILGELFDPNAEPEEPEPEAAEPVRHATPELTVQAPEPKAAEEKGELPPGWVSKVDPKGRTYYICKYLRSTQWNPPTAEQWAEAEMHEEHQTQEAASPRTSQSLRPEPVAAAPKSPRVSQRVDKPVGSLASSTVSPTAAAVNTAPVDIPNSVNVGGLPTTPGFPKGIEKKVTPKGRVYYANHATRKNFWSLEEACPGFQEPPSSKNTSFQAQSEAGLPPAWEKRLDTKSNRPYYVDHNTKTTHWELPNALRR